MKPQGLDKSSNHHPDLHPGKLITFFDKKIIFERCFHASFQKGPVSSVEIKIGIREGPASAS